MKIRKAKHKDLEMIQKIWVELMEFHEQYDPCFTRSKNGHVEFGKYLSSQISSKTALVLVACENKAVVAYLMAKVEYKPAVFAERKFGFICDLAVTSSKRRSAVGTKLYESAMAWFKYKKVKRVELGVSTSNPVSNAFWSKMGLSPYYAKLYIDV